MQTTYRIKAQELSVTFLKSLKTMFAGQEVEIIVKSIPKKETKTHKGLLKFVKDNRKNAPFVANDIDIRRLIDDSQYPNQ